MAIGSGDIGKITVATGKLMAFKNRYIEQQQETIELNVPKVEFAEAVECTEGSVNIGIFAKTLFNKISKLPDGNKMGQNNLFKWLRDNKYLRNGYEEKNKPYQKYVDMKIFEVKMSVYTDNLGKVKKSYKPLITGKGQLYLTKKIKESKII